jgi:hypothetical protein
MTAAHRFLSDSQNVELAGNATFEEMSDATSFRRPIQLLECAGGNLPNLCGKPGKGLDTRIRRVLLSHTAHNANSAQSKVFVGA